MKIKLFTPIILATTLSACSSTSNGGGWPEELKLAANQINSSLPMMIDAETRIDSTFAFMNTFTYNYTIVTSSVNEINVQAFRDLMTKKIFNTVCTKPDMASFVQNNTEVNYAYVDSEGKHITKISVDTRQCEKI
ncbi:hypothetical protein [Pseudoalteromonas sp. MMG005]|uniref:hypothetical protein n=1 Tax=Pseudoalteromonas sp. MMG005 TaxID=2822682 RepID=UPI001B3A4141|nr:hypothetical protein [Pseudoalteromonas sp. MMG005]MBQ4848273.1 hypothetical protein [Pseudoalteromonas sp. MMG005]